MKAPKFPSDVSETLADAAVEYAEHGLAVFPCAPRKKVPLLAASDGGKGYADATTNVEQVASWWKNKPNANIGLVPGLSGLVVIDVDGPDGEAALKELGLD